MDLKPHKIAELLPMMSEAEYASLRDDIAASRGNRDPILRFEGKILDGRNRYRACVELKLKPKFEDFKGTEAEALAFVKSRMLHRNLDAPRKACVALEFSDEYERQAKERKRANGGDKKSDSKKVYSPIATPERAMDSLGKQFGVNPTYLYQAKKLRDVSKSLFRDVFEGKIPLSEAVRKSHRQAKAKTIEKQAAAVQIKGDDCRIIAGDCREKIEELPAGSVDLVFTDPPYGIGEKYNSFNDKLSRGQLMGLLEGCIGRLPRVLKRTASVFVMMSSRYGEDVGALLREAGLHRQETIIWAESFGSHNPKFWTDSYRVIQHYTKDPDEFTFNHQDTRLYISSWRKENGDKRHDADGKMPGNVWGVWTDRGVARLVDNSPERIPDKRAVNQLPVALVKRAVLAASNPGELVLDPFHGTGTTARAALLTGRRYLGFEVDSKIAQASELWIKAALAAEGKSRE